jgi:uncharacterized membrane protein YeaQ/YmgE (transglycosylase-associated protein family)
MGVETILIWLLVGLVAGLIASLVVRGGGFGILGDIVVGILGAILGGWLLPRLGVDIGGGWLATIATATIGAIILLLILRVIRRA